MLQMKTTPMEDDIKILKVEYNLQGILEYIINFGLDHTQISNLSSDDQTEVYKCFK
jgi:hypothetical protein